MSKHPGYFRQFLGHLRKTVQIVQQRERFVGRDDFGNQYFEKLADPSKGLKNLRRVEPVSRDQFEVPKVPVEWMTWLQGRREQPPLDEDIARNYSTMIKTQYRAQELEQSRLRDNSASDSSAQRSQSETGGKFPAYSEYDDVPRERETEPHKIPKKHDDNR